MSNQNIFVFQLLKIIAWVIFVALCIEAGGLLVNFFFALYKPDIVQHLYQKLDLSDLYHRSPTHYFSVYSFILVISVVKAYLFYVLVQLVTSLNLAKPFSRLVSKYITRISYFTFSIGILSYIAKAYVKNLHQRGFNLNAVSQFWVDSQAFILMAAVIYVIAVIFAKGVALQNENDLTV